MISLTDDISPISADMVGKAKASSLAEMMAAPTVGVYVSCNDPESQGKTAIQHVTAAGAVTLVDPKLYNVRSAVHEYGGGAFCVGPHGDGVIFTDFPSHVVYWLSKEKEAVQIFPAAATKSACRLADFKVVEGAIDVFLLAVMEDHSDPTNVQNSIVAVALDGTAKYRTLACGKDFYSSPCWDDSSQRLAFVAWDHPNMPWDHSVLYVTKESIDPSTSDQVPDAQPVTSTCHNDSFGVYSPAWFQGKLFFLYNQSGWYNIYKWEANTNGLKCLYPIDADFSEAKCGWMLGCHNFVFMGDKRMLVANYAPPPDSGNDDSSGSRLVFIDLMSGSVREYGRSCLPPHSISSLAYSDSEQALYFFGGSTSAPPAVWVWKTPGVDDSVAVPVFDPASDLFDADVWTHLKTAMSTPKHIKFPSPSSCNGLGYAYGHYYPPSLSSPEAKPPLLVKAHGGPTARTSTTFRLDIQYWTTRGFAVLDVDYGGSTGYGRAYQKSLRGNWGILDIDDACNGAKYCVSKGLAREDWLCIDGSSAGGYSTLAALVFRDTFRAGASLYGIGDLNALAQETHKFESRYLDGLIGPYPEMKHVYDERCPINFVDNLTCPVILLQGGEDKVVPPNQAEQMFEALSTKNLPTTLVIYKGEQHGFRKPENVSHALSSEYYFFCRVFGIQPQSEGAFHEIPIGSRIEL
ncbi:hypothetical protein FisN_2Hh267 [Fistulifera solaris]|uniref:Peptidase S9 prolyl oligopeptidase catalytic domain-containing protein n=1 Tax=Fistulifera solaris TaxID=1519565 RepID=A0A1Z5JEK3_FISSO|nr:hypothetical protein FisN_2Hh267 [Fistulifera solaris]|eukprot:GAX12435.1 hypothetical protein FisN_2Hh267 [Fistulifera solaris]